MESSPIFRELVLLVQSKDDVQNALDILYNRSTISQIADQLGQEIHSFYGDGDVLVLTYTSEQKDCNENDAAKVLGNHANDVMKDLIEAIRVSTAPIELVIKYCNLSTETIIFLSEALRENRSFVGFSVTGNPGNCEVGEIALKYACIRTAAPIRWFQGEALSDTLIEARQLFASQKTFVSAELFLDQEPRRTPTSGSPPTTDDMEESKSDDDDIESKTSNGSELCVGSPNPAAYRKKFEPHEAKVTPSKVISFPASNTHRMRKEEPKVRWNDRELWRLKVRKLLRTIHKVKDEKEIDSLVSNLELYDLQVRIDYLLFGIDGAPEKRSGLVTPPAGLPWPSSGDALRLPTDSVSL